MNENRPTHVLTDYGVFGFELFLHEVKQNSVGEMQSVREGVGEEGDEADEPAPAALERVVGRLRR